MLATKKWKPRLQDVVKDKGLHEVFGAIAPRAGKGKKSDQAKTDMKSASESACQLVAMAKRGVNCLKPKNSKLKKSKIPFVIDLLLIIKIRRFSSGTIVTPDGNNLEL